VSVLPHTGSAPFCRKGHRTKRLLDSKDGGLPLLELLFISYTANIINDLGVIFHKPIGCLLLVQAYCPNFRLSQIIIKASTADALH
jgi:hypothetical protein